MIKNFKKLVKFCFIVPTQTTRPDLALLGYQEVRVKAKTRPVEKKAVTRNMIAPYFM